MGLLDGRVALITGASRGIGAATARALAAEGARLGLASRSGSDLGIAGSVAQAADVRDPAAMRAIAAATAARFGGIDILVINAGVGAYGPFLELPEADLEAMIDINVKGALYSARAALPWLVKSAERRPGDHRQRSRPTRPALRSGLLRIEVRAGRHDQRPGPRAS